MSDKGVLQFSSAQPRSQSGTPVASKAILVPSWQRARDQSCSALLAGEMCVVVTGLPGTGKTLLVDTVARALRSTGWTTVTLAARLPSNAEFATLKGSAAILIDDADRLSATELRTLNRLRQCSVLLAGAVGLEKRCPADSRVTLTPLPLDEVATYVRLWLERADLDPDLITEAAVAHLTDVSAGIPQALSMLLVDSLKAAQADGSEQIEEHHIDNAAWHHVEHTAARRLNRAGLHSIAEPRTAKPIPALLDADLEKRLSLAPFADAPVGDERVPLVSFRALGYIGFGLAVGLLTAAALLTVPQWSQWAVATYSAIAPKRDAPSASTATPLVAPTVSEIPPVAEPPVAEPPVSEPPVPASAAPAIGQPGPAENVPSAASPPSPEIGEVRAAHSAPPNSVPVDASLPASASALPLAPAVVRMLNQRGQEMIDLNDYSAGRLLFSRAAESGSVKAMIALGRSYDPYISGSVAPVADVDPAQAARWYGKAAALGSSDAAILLQQLERGPRE